MDPHSNVMGLLGLFWDYDRIILPLAVLLNVMFFCQGNPEEQNNIGLQF